MEFSVFQLDRHTDTITFLVNTDGGIANKACTHQSRQPDDCSPARTAKELASNPFLTGDDPSLQDRMGHPGDQVATFAEIRYRKDVFRRASQHKTNELHLIQVSIPHCGIVVSKEGSANAISRTSPVNEIMYRVASPVKFLATVSRNFSHSRLIWFISC